MTRGYSLRRRLVALLTGTLAAIWLVSAFAAYQNAHRAADELLDAQLTQIADTLLTIVAGGEIEHFVEELHEHARPAAVPIAFEVWHADDGRMRRLVTSAGHAGFSTELEAGFGEGRHQGAHWRFYAVQDDDAEYRVVVGQAHAARQTLARDMSLSLLLPALLALPLMALAVWVVVGRAVQPVERLALRVGGLDPQSLRALDETDVLPNEIAPLRAALNALVRRVNVAFDNERRFTADAAHELRTPLAALKVQAQVALRAQVADAQRHALLQVIAAVDRMAHLVEQLLTLARVDPERTSDVAPLDPGEIIEAACRDFAPQAKQKRQHLHAAIASACTIAANAGWLQIALRNLVDNAVRYAGDEAHIEVRLAENEAGCSITVADDGPGVPAAARARLSERFVRGDVDEEGCGLGLSIVSRIAALLHAELEFGDGLPRADGGHGLAVTLRFPRVAG
jgi:two-component system sensor histidine kinase QseC